jgi:hypothetical protein
MDGSCELGMGTCTSHDAFTGDSSVGALQCWELHTLHIPWVEVGMSYYDTYPDTQGSEYFVHVWIHSRMEQSLNCGKRDWFTVIKRAISEGCMTRE